MRKKPTLDYSFCGYSFYDFPTEMCAECLSRDKTFLSLPWRYDLSRRRGKSVHLAEFADSILTTTLPIETNQSSIKPGSLKGALFYFHIFCYFVLFVILEAMFSSRFISSKTWRLHFIIYMCCTKFYTFSIATYSLCKFISWSYYLCSYQMQVILFSVMDFVRWWTLYTVTYWHSKSLSTRVSWD